MCAAVVAEKDEVGEGPPGVDADSHEGRLEDGGGAGDLLYPLRPNEPP